MGIELPVELTEVAAKAGVTWPKADEDAMRSSATAWREAGDKIKGLGTSSDGAATRALSGVTGATGDAARGRWAKVVAPDGDFQRAARGCHAAADRLDHAAQQVGAAKVEIVRELTTLAKNNDAAHASANAGNPNALLGLDTLTKGAAANVANLQNTLSSAIRLDSGVDMSQASPPVNTAPGAHGPGGGGGLLSPVTNVVGGVVAPVAAAVEPVVAGAAPVVGAVTAPVAPVVGAVTAPVAPVVGMVTDAAAPVMNAAAPVTAPAAAVVMPAVDAVPGGHDAVGPAFGEGDGHGRGEGPGNGPGDGSGRGQSGPPVLPGLVAEVGQAVTPAVAPVTHVVGEAIPSVQGTLGPIAEGTTQTSAAVLEQPLIRGGDVHGAPAAAGPAPAAAAQAAPASPALGGAPMGGVPAGGPMGGPVGAVGGAIGGAVGGVPSATSAVASQVGAVVGQQGGAQAPGQQGQAAQQAAKAADAKSVDAKAAEARATEAKAAEAKVGEAKAGAQAVAGKSGSSVAGQASQFGGQAGTQAGQAQGPGQTGQAQPGTSSTGQGSGAPAAAKDPAKDLTKDALDALQDGSADAAAGGERGAQQVVDTITSPSAPLAGVDLGGGSGSLTDRLDNSRDQALGAGVGFDIARHAYTAAAAGSWFMAVFLSAGQGPRLAPKPARQLPPPAQQDDEQLIPRFAPHDHPQAGLVDTAESHPAEATEGLGKDHPVVQELIEGYDALAGMHERDWESLFQHEDGSPRWPVEREGGYEDSRPEVLQQGAELDRFGTPEGRVLSKAGTPFAQRSLPPSALDEGYRRYRVEKDLPVHRTISAPWFGQPGGGSRYRTTCPVADLVALGYLTEITA
ncbi:TNT domain-containing protein [Lentzea kentuckyensis]|uniref:TNT domain-containing protein n=1 Tax=Lentzea kentuckyensis TaxID=360086 RepID=UPI000A3A33B3|nr:TNT domain-containing protein [Lentzea kentuckyensis]